MKKISLALSCCVISIISFGQVQKGQWLVGGSAALDLNDLQNDKSSRTTTISVSPDVGYFFVRKLAGGLRMNYEWWKINDPMYGSTSSISVAPFLRYYWLPSSSKVNVLGEVSYGWGRNKQSGASSHYNQYTLAAGPAVFLSPQIALEFALQYQSFGGKNYDGRNDILGLHVGFQLHLGKAKGKS